MRSIYLSEMYQANQSHLENCRQLFLAANMKATFQHSLNVAEQAKQMAEKVGQDPKKAYLAGLLHDIGGIIPNQQRIFMLEERQETIYPEEKQLPLLLHQRCSKIIVKELFAIDDPAILSAVNCHTTCHGDASPFDQLIFLADKLSWDRLGKPPFYEAVNNAYPQGLKHACSLYFAWLRSSDDLKVAHPWLLAAEQVCHIKGH